MEFISGSTLSSHSSSTPLDIRHWKAASDQIIGINQLPESYSIIKAAYDPDDKTQVEYSTFTNLPVASSHEDTHHFALEYSQAPVVSDPDPELFLESASTLALPSSKILTINSTHYPYFPPLNTALHRATHGPVLLKVGYDPDLVDIDIAVRPVEPIVARCFAVSDHQKIFQEGSPIDKNSLVYGADATFHGDSYSIGAKYTSDDHFVGFHALKSFHLHALRKRLTGDCTTPSPSAESHPGPAQPPSPTTDTLSTLSRLIPTSVDMGMEYFVKPDDMMDTFTIGSLFVWQDVRARRYYLGPPSSQHPGSKDEAHPDAERQSDTLSVPQHPTTMYVHVNGIGTASFAYTSMLYETAWRHRSSEPPPSPKPLQTTISLLTPSPQHTSNRDDDGSNATDALGEESPSIPDPLLSLHSTSKIDDNHQFNLFNLDFRQVQRKKKAQTPPLHATDTASVSSVAASPSSLLGGFPSIDLPSSVVPRVWSLWHTLFRSLTSIVHDAILHASISVASRFDYSIGSAESSFEAGLQSTLHVFSPTTSSSSSPPPHSSSTELPTTKTDTPQTTYNLSSTHLLGFLLSSIRGLCLSYTRLFASSISCCLTVTIPPAALLSPQHSRLHHSFPPIPALHQPISTTEAYPMQQDDSDWDFQAAAQSPLLSWYPAEYSFNDYSSFIPHQDDSTLPSNPTVFHSMHGQETSPPDSVNRDPITRRLSLCSQNGEWTRPSPSGATPTPLWDIISDMRIGFTIGYGDL